MIEIPQNIQRYVGGSVSTGLIPLLIIYKEANTIIPLETQIENGEFDFRNVIGLSTQDYNIQQSRYDNMSAGERSEPIFCKGLLLSAPKFSSSLDFIYNKHKVSSVSVDIANVETSGKAFSDNFTEFLGAVCRIYFATPNSFSLDDDCVPMFTGVIKRFKQDNIKVSLELEDITSIKYQTEIPTTILPDDHTIRTEDRGKPITMVYGEVEKSLTRQTALATGSGQDDTGSWLIDRPDVQIGGVFSTADESEVNPAIANTSHPINDPSGNVRMTQWTWQSDWRDFFYCYDKDYLRISNRTPGGWIGLNYHQYDNFESTGDYDIGIRHIKLHMTRQKKQLDVNYDNNSITMNQSYIDEFSNKISDYDLSVDSEEKPLRPPHKITGRSLIGRIYRPVRRVTFFACPTDYSDGPHSDYRFWGLSPEFATKNEGEHYDSLTGGEGNDNNNKGLNEIILRNGDHSVDRQYIMDWFMDPEDPMVNQYEMTKSMWRCDEIIEASHDLVEGDPTKGFTDYNWVENNMKGEQNDYIGEFPVEWIQNSRSDTGLVFEAETTECDTGFAYARFHFDKLQSSLPCLTKVLFDAKYYKRNGRWVTAQNSNNNFFGFTFSDSARSGYIQYTGTGGDWWSHVKEYLGWSKTFHEDWQHDYPYGPRSDEHNNNVHNNKIHYGNDIMYDHRWKTVGQHDYINFITPKMMPDGNEDSDKACCAAVFLKHFYLFNDFIIPNSTEYDFYANVVGRQDSDGNTIQTPHRILEHIFETELGMNENFKGMEQADTEMSDWKFGITESEPITLQDFVDKLFQQSSLIPRVDEKGVFDIVSRKDILSDDVDNWVTIKSSDVISYNYELTKIEDVKNAVNIKYKYEPAGKKTLKETGTSITNAEGFETYDLWSKMYYAGYDDLGGVYDIDYYKLTDEEAELNFTAENIYDINTAKRLQRKLLMWYLNQHLIIKCTIPINYIALQIGDYIKFDSLIQDKKAFGFDYTVNQAKNGQLIYNYFVVTKIDKTTKDIKIEAIQMHRGELGFPAGFFVGDQDNNDIPMNGQQRIIDNGDIQIMSGGAIGTEFTIMNSDNITHDQIIDDEAGEDDEEYESDTYFNLYWEHSDIQEELGENDNFNVTYGEVVEAYLYNAVIEAVEITLKIKSISKDFQVIVDGERLEFEAGEDLDIEGSLLYDIFLTPNFYDNNFDYRIQIQPKIQWEDQELTLGVELKALIDLEEEEEETEE